MRHVHVLATLGILLATSVAAFAVPAASPTSAAEAAAPAYWDDVVTSFDGTPIHVTVFQPGGASADEPVPVVLNSHGWSGSRGRTPGGVVGALLDAGYGVVTVDARGHGASGGGANVHNKDVEVHDFVAVLDWIHDRLEWVQKDATSGIDKDVVAGATGGSYGGGYQLMTASYDRRLDALVPEITWNDLTYSLAPGGVIKSVWVDALYGAAQASGTRLNPDIDRWWREVNLLNEIPADAYAHFKASSPQPADITADVLLIQGVPDVLFNLNEAMRNYDALEGGAAGDVRLVTHLSGHILPGLQPMALHQARPSNLHPCGSITDMTLAWFDEHLRGAAGAADAIPEVSYALENGECVALDAMNAETFTVELAALAAPQVAGSLLVPLTSEPGVVAGIPRVTATVTTPLPASVNLGLVLAGPAGARLVDDQSTGAKLQPGQPLDIDLAGVATRLEPGDTLYLRIDGLNEWYAHNGGRIPGATLLTDVVVTLPVVPGA